MAAQVLNLINAKQNVPGAAITAYPPSTDYIQGLAPVYTTITSATTLTASQSGGIFTIGTVGPYTITLPAPTTAGLKYTFKLGAVAEMKAATNITIASSGVNVFARLLNSGTATAPVPAFAAAGTAVTNVIFTGTGTANDQCKQGDTVTFESNGTNYYASGQSCGSGTGGFTLS
jgi:hypothetical protein